MTNLPELLNLHHSNPLGLHPIVIPIFLLVLAVGMHITSTTKNTPNFIRYFIPW